MIFENASTPCLLLGYAILSVSSIIAYKLDKSAAIQGKRRIPERTLHLLSLLGGWPGAILAQKWFRHKTQKTSFRVVFWLTVVLNLALFGWIAKICH